MMRRSSHFWLALVALVAPWSAMASPLLIAHRGASADRPEHTLAAYRLAIEQGADYIEPDLVPTKDGHLVARHENEIGGTTDVADRPEYAARKTTKTIDGEIVTGWFTEDFTLAELKSLRARERLPQLRPANAKFNGQETIPTFDEVLALAREKKVGVYPETKHPSYFRNLGLPLEARLLEALARFGHKDERAPVFIQSFEVGNLKALSRQTKIRLVQLAAAAGAPADSPETPYASMLAPPGLKAISGYADGIGVEKAVIFPRSADGRLASPTTLVADAHKAGLLVHVWTLRPENFFLPADYRIGNEPIARGDAKGEIRRFLDIGVDGLFSDSVPDARAAIDAMPKPARAPAPR
jgi:glycerophosphoryl diester phosphodiesterase